MNNVRKFGFELELFARNAAREVVMINKTSIPHDQCGYLAEARGEHHINPRHARHLLQSAFEELKIAASEEDITLVLADTLDIPKEFLRIARRTCGKDPAKSFFMGGRVYKNNNPRAGLHIHFGTERVVSLSGEEEDDDGVVQKQKISTVVPEICNMPRIIALMDKAFKEEIKRAKRMPGEYELKHYGFEYRSLPATTDLDKVVEVLEEIADEDN